jgi:hypothetical protein
MRRGRLGDLRLHPDPAVRGLALSLLAGPKPIVSANGIITAMTFDDETGRAVAETILRDDGVALSRCDCGATASPCHHALAAIVLRRELSEKLAPPKIPIPDAFLSGRRKKSENESENPDDHDESDEDGNDRKRAMKEEAVSSGAEFLSSWAGALLRNGSAAAKRAGREPLVEAAEKTGAHGLRGIEAELTKLAESLSDEEWDESALAVVARIFLFAKAWAGRETIPKRLLVAAMRYAGVSPIVGGKARKNEIRRVEDSWKCLGRKWEVKNGLCLREHWLLGDEGTAVRISDHSHRSEADARPRLPPPGERLRGTIAIEPSPFFAVGIIERAESDGRNETSIKNADGLADGAALRRRTLAQDPWTLATPCFGRAVAFIERDGRLFAEESDGTIARVSRRTPTDEMMDVVGMGRVEVFGTLGDDGLEPLLISARDGFETEPFRGTLRGNGTRR